MGSQESVLDRIQFQVSPFQLRFAFHRQPSNREWELLAMAPAFQPGFQFSHSNLPRTGNAGDDEVHLAMTSRYTVATAVTTLRTFHGRPFEREGKGSLLSPLTFHELLMS